MNELAIHSDSSNDQWRPPFNTETLQEGIVQSETLSSAHINAISSCLDAATGILDIFLALPVRQIRCLPIYNFIRSAFALVILLKMYFSTSPSSGGPDNGLRGVIERDSLRVEHYLEALLAKFHAAAVDDKCRPAVKFLLVLAMLKTWFLKHKDGGSGDVTAAGGANATTNAADPGARRHGGHPASASQVHEMGPSTPLQLLSEVATGGEPAAPRLAMAGRNLGPIQPRQASSSSVPLSLSGNASSSGGEYSPVRRSTFPANNSNPYQQPPLPGPADPPGLTTSNSDTSSPAGHRGVPTAAPSASGFPSPPPWMGQQQQIGLGPTDSSGLPSGFDTGGVGLMDIDPNNVFPMFSMNGAWLDIDSMMQNLGDHNLFPF
jgi:RalA-binding protein 1